MHCDINTNNSLGSVTCTATGAGVISQEFTNACNKLNQGLKFEKVLDTNDHVFRPVDSKSMNYHFGCHG